MVKIPKYYVKVTVDDTYETWMVCKYKKEGYKTPDFFLRADGTEADYYEIARYETSSGNRSAANSTPTTSQNKAYFRQQAALLGNGWHTSLPAEKFNCLEILMSIEFATRNIQSIAVGLTGGVTSAQKTGTTDNLIITTDNKGIKPYSGVVSDPTSNTQAFSWRGIENPFGNILEFIDGIIVNDRKVYYCRDWTKWADTITKDYVQIVGTVPTQNGYINALAQNDLRLPIGVNSVGDSDSDYCDYYTMPSVDYAIALYGGSYLTGLRAGIFHWNFAHDAAMYNGDVGSRLSRSF